VEDLEEVVDDQEVEDTEVDEDDLVEVEGMEEVAQAAEDIKVETLVEDTREEPLEREVTRVEDDHLAVDTRVVADQVEDTRADDQEDDQVETLDLHQDDTQVVDLLQEVRAVETSVSLVRS
jgi:hypothetical protein